MEGTELSRSRSTAGTGCLRHVNKLSDEAHFCILVSNKKLQTSDISILDKTMKCSSGTRCTESTLRAK